MCHLSQKLGLFTLFSFGNAWMTSQGHGEIRSQLDESVDQPKTLQEAQLLDLTDTQQFSALPSWSPPWQEPVELQAALVSVARQESARRAEALPSTWSSEVRWRAWRALEDEVKRAWKLESEQKITTDWYDQMEISEPKPFSHTWPGGSEGFLLNAPRLKDSPLWDTRRYKNYATPEAIIAIKAGVYELHSVAPDAPMTIIGDLSKRYGGHFPPHLSHQSGRDADIGYFVKGPIGQNLKGLMQTSARQLDVEKTWAFIHGMLKTGLVDQIYIDHQLQKKLYQEAKRRKIQPEQLKAWFSYPFKRGGLVRHLQGHADHMHVRFKAPSSEAFGAELVRSQSPRSLRPKPRYVRIRKGDTLARLAQRHRVSIQTLSMWNHLPKKPNQIIKKRSVIIGFHTPWHLAQK